MLLTEDANSITLPTKAAGVKISIDTNGSAIDSMPAGSGSSAAERIFNSCPFLSFKKYSTEGEDIISESPNSLFNLSEIISTWSIPKKPRRKPRPRPTEDSGSYDKEASVSFNLPSRSEEH